MYRQGDILLVHNDIPKDAKQLNTGNIVLALGSATGHSHTVQNATRYESGGVTYVDCPTLTQLTHNEHATIELPAGTYKLVKQVEYTPQGIRDVED